MNDRNSIELIKAIKSLIGDEVQRARASLHGLNRELERIEESVSKAENYAKQMIEATDALERHDIPYERYECYIWINTTPEQLPQVCRALGSIDPEKTLTSIDYNKPDHIQVRCTPRRYPIVTINYSYKPKENDRCQIVERTVVDVVCNRKEEEPKEDT